MKASKGIHFDESFKLGKTEPRIDDRTIQYSTIRSKKKITPPPAEWDYDSTFKFKIALKMWLNDTYGDCVIAARANQTERFEAFEQQKVIPGTDKDVKTEYFKESGGHDSGLVMLDSLNDWRKGWTFAGQNLDIFAFAKLDSSNMAEVMEAIYYLEGINIGMALPLSAKDQINAGKPWDVTTGPRSKRGSWGGHCVLIKQYSTSKKLIPCMTWSMIQPMTWAFFQKYCDEPYAIVDNADKFVKNSPVDVNKLKAILAEITK